MKTTPFFPPITTKTIFARGFSWSAGMYRNVAIPNSNAIPVSELLEPNNPFDKGEEPGSEAYASGSPFTMLRTRALQEHSYLLSLKPDAERIERYVSTLMRAIIQKERAIRDRAELINNEIQQELDAGQSPKRFQFRFPMSNEVQQLGRFDACIYDREYKSKIWLVTNYRNGFVTPTEDGFVVTPGPSLEIRIIRTRIDSDTPKPGFYALILPMNLSEYGTINVIQYLGTAKRLPLLRKGDVLFGEAGFQKGRSVVLLDGIENCTTNAHGLYARRTDGDVRRSIFFRCIFNWYRTMRLIDLMAVGGSGGHFSPKYFDYVRIPKFPDAKREQIVDLYHKDGARPSEPQTLGNFVEWHERYNTNLGIWELDRELRALKAELKRVQDQIIYGLPVSLTLAS